MKDQTVLLFLGELGGGEIIVILLVVLLLFGAKRIPELVRALGSGIREFKDAANGMRHELESSVMANEPPVREQTYTGSTNRTVLKNAGLQQKHLRHTAPGNT